MKSLKESLFGDNITNDVNIDFDFLVKYTMDKVNDAVEKHINVEMDRNNRGDYEVVFWSSEIKNAKNLYEKININFIIAHPTDDVAIKPYVPFGIDKTFVWYQLDDHRLIAEVKGITFDSIWGSKDPGGLIKTIDGFFDAFERIDKEPRPIITNPRQTTINNIGLALFYDKIKTFFKKYPKIKKIN